MKIRAASVALSAVLAATGASFAQGARKVGVGVILGEPIGGDVKVWNDERTAFDAGVGVSDGNSAFWADVLIHDWSLFHQSPPGRLGGYVGAGPQLRTGDDARFGLRTIAGVAYLPAGHPLELFVEAGPLFRLTQGGQVDGVGGAGLRIYFDGSAPRPR